MSVYSIAKRLAPELSFGVLGQGMVYPKTTAYAQPTGGHRLAWAMFGCVYPHVPQEGLAMKTGSEAIDGRRVYPVVAGPFKTDRAVAKHLVAEARRALAALAQAGFGLKVACLHLGICGCIGFKPNLVDLLIPEPPPAKTTKARTHLNATFRCRCGNELVTVSGHGLPAPASRWVHLACADAGRDGVMVPILVDDGPEGTWREVEPDEWTTRGGWRPDVSELQIGRGYEYEDGKLFWCVGVHAPEPDGKDCDGLLPGHCPEHRCEQPDACLCVSEP